MTTDAQQATIDRAARAAPPLPAMTEPGPGSPSRPAKRPPRRPRQVARRARRRPYRAEIAALADTTAGLPPPWRQQTIRIVRAIMNLFKCAWREVSQPAR